MLFQVPKLSTFSLIQVDSGGVTSILSGQRHRDAAYKRFGSGIDIYNPTISLTEYESNEPKRAMPPNLENALAQKPGAKAMQTMHSFQSPFENRFIRDNKNMDNPDSYCTNNEKRPPEDEDTRDYSGIKRPKTSTLKTSTFTL